MDTTRSERIVQRFQQKGPNLSRKTTTYEHTYAHDAEEVFHQLCPSREADWIPGWDCDLLYTGTGYMEADCVFSTSEDNPSGPGLWVVSRYEPNERVELVRVLPEVVIHLRLKVTANPGGGSTCRWRATTTALNEKGNEMVESMPDNNPVFKLAAEGLEYFLDNGELMPTS